MAKSETLKNYNRWKATDRVLYASKYVLPLAPATVVTAYNWEEWFAKSSSSLPLGFATLLISIFITVIGISKKDEIVQKNISPLFSILLVLGCWAVTFLFLANIMSEMGYMLLATCSGVLAGAVADEVDMKLAKPRRKEYEGYVTKNTLSASAKKKAERKAKAIEEARKMAEEHQAVE